MYLVDKDIIPSFHSPHHFLLYYSQPALLFLTYQDHLIVTSDPHLTIKITNCSLYTSFQHLFSNHVPDTMHTNINNASSLLLRRLSG